MLCCTFQLFSRGYDLIQSQVKNLLLVKRGTRSNEK